MNSRLLLVLAAVILLAVLVGVLVLLTEGGEARKTPAAPASEPAATAAGAMDVAPVADETRRPAAPTAADASPTPLIAPGAESAFAHGRVVTRAGDPRANVRVEVLRVVREGFLDRFTPTGFAVATDADGRFALAALPVGEPLGLEARTPDLAPGVLAPFTLEAGEDQDLGDVVLDPGLTLRGTIWNDERQPLPGAHLAVRDLTRELADGSQAELVAETDSGEDGTYSVPHLAQRQYTLEVTRPGYAPVRTVLSFVLGRPTEGWRQDFTLELADSQLGGQVRDQQEQPVPDVDVRIMRRAQGSAYFSSTATTDDEGRFLFDELPQGRFDLSLNAPDHYLEQTRKLESGRVDYLVYVRPALAVHGQLVADDPPATFTVSARPDANTGAGLLAGADRTRRYEATDPPGSFLFDGLRPGRYVLEVAAPGWALTSSQDLILGPDVPVAEVTIPLLRGGRLNGRLTPALAGTRVELRDGEWDPALPLEQAFPTPPLPGLVTTTNEQGAFALEHVPAGTYVLTARPADAPVLHRREVRVAEGGETDVGTLTVRAGGAVAGTVTGTDGRPAAGARVVLAGDEDHQQTRTALDGSFRFESVPPGTYELTATPAAIQDALRLQAKETLTVTAANTGPGGMTRAELVLAERSLQGASPFKDG